MPRDEAESIRLLRRGAELGDPDAQNEYGVALRDGSRVASDAQQSFQWFEKAAWSDYTDAQFNLGLAYLHGTGVERDQVRGVAWLEVCRDETYREAIRALGSARSGLTPEQLEPPSNCIKSSLRASTIEPRWLAPLLPISRHGSAAVRNSASSLKP